MPNGFTVHPEELRSGGGKMLHLADSAKSVTRELTGVLGSMASAAGHPAVTSALAELGAAALKATMDTATALEHIGTSVQTASQHYDTTDRNAGNHLGNSTKGAS